MKSPASLTVGLVTCGDPDDPTVSSGLPASLALALQEVVGDVLALSDVPSPWHARAALVIGALPRVRPRDVLEPKSARARLRNVGRSSPPMLAARARTAGRQLDPDTTIEGLIQIGGDYSAPASIPMVTYQDSTVLQAARSYPWPNLRGLTGRDIDRYAQAQREAYESATACCVLTHWVAESIVSDYGVPASKVRVAGLGANHEIETSDADTRDWSHPRFLFVGIDWQRKNGQMVLEAFARVREEVPGAHLDVVGGHPRLDVDGVTGHGRLSMGVSVDRERLAGLFREATAFVMPSLHEPSGTVFIEAAAAGIPSIGTSNGGAKTCIGDGGYVVDPTSLRELTTAMLALCDPDTARSLGARARERASLFTWRKVAERLIRAFDFPDIDQAGLAEFL